mgnify:CR=1 FL=1
METKMFCFQCQEAAKGTGCTHKGVCGKDDKTANRMDFTVIRNKRYRDCRHLAPQRRDRKLHEGKPFYDRRPILHDHKCQL